MNTQYANQQLATKLKEVARRDQTDGQNPTRFSAPKTLGQPVDPEKGVASFVNERMSFRRAHRELSVGSY